MCDHQPVVGREGRRQKMPAQRAVEEPHFALLGNSTLNTNKQSEVYDDFPPHRRSENENLSRMFVNVNRTPGVQFL